MRLEQIIASSCRQKMLLALVKVKETHVTQLVWMINSTYNEVDGILKSYMMRGL